ncbi:MAG TPA: signal peptide peptidase SppA [Candidatus Eisenbacteria bacterium]|nr:signal peptide peptidase SppA [Candidatus Eisenbacteria bacterium]
MMRQPRHALASLTFALGIGFTAPLGAQPLEFSADFQPQAGVATVEGAAALPLNPAALGFRYRSELLLAFREKAERDRAYGAWATFGSLGFVAAAEEDARSAIGIGIGGGDPRFSAGASLAWLDGHGSRASDLTFGLLSRPAPWLAMGATAAHVAETEFEGTRLGRAYTVGLGLRPLAWSRSSAARFGPRFTLGADVRMVEDEPAEAARTRAFAELEPLPGIALRGSVERGGFRIGIGVFGVRGGYHGGSRYDDEGERHGGAHALSFHEDEDRTVLAGPRDRRVGVLRPSGALGDEALPDFSVFGGSSTRSAGDLRRQLDQALEDPLTRGVLLEPRGISNMAQIEELRTRIQRLRASGKPVVAFLETGGGRGDLYLASACNRVVATEEAIFAALGLRTERRSYRRWLASLGLKIDRASVGDFKSAYRSFSQDSTPKADREQIEQLLDRSQSLFVGTVAADRHMDPARLERILDGRWWPARELQRAGLIDTVAYREDALAILGRLSGLSDKPHRVSMSQVRPARRPWRVPRPVAVVYASGGIETGGDGHDLLNGPYMGSDAMTRRLERAFRDPEVKVVVLRIESPGGSGLASNLILHQTQRLKRETGKPLIVSMGGVAASGGYYIALGADRIYADRYTRTGSIGVVFVKPSLEGWYREHHVRQEAFERGPFMGGSSLGRDWTPRWQAAADSTVRNAYEVFKTKVSQGRKLDPAQVEAVAQGRVWMGEEARERRLVDAIGGLDEAIEEAKRLARVRPGEKIELLEVRRPRPRLVERLAGMAVRDMFGSVRIPQGEAIDLRADVDIDE